MAATNTIKTVTRQAHTKRHRFEKKIKKNCKMQPNTHTYTYTQFYAKKIEF